MFAPQRCVIAALTSRRRCCIQAAARAQQMLQRIDFDDVASTLCLPMWVGTISPRMYDQHVAPGAIQPCQHDHLGADLQITQALATGRCGDARNRGY